jgi:hypothetical protein
MKITKSQLKQIIKEELEETLSESWADVARREQPRKQQYAKAAAAAPEEADTVIASFNTEDPEELKEKFRAWQVDTVHLDPAAPKPVVKAVREKLLAMGIEGI